MVARSKSLIRDVDVQTGLFREAAESSSGIERIHVSGNIYRDITVISAQAPVMFGNNLAQFQPIGKYPPLIQRTRYCVHASFRILAIDLYWKVDILSTNRAKQIQTF
jgi:hypothetical protein